VRIVRDAFGDVSRDGTTIHTGVRILQDDKKRVAVFRGKAEPVNVYEPDEVTFTVSRKPCACKGDPPKMTLMRLWDASERAHA
jgi:hypothetical protein